MTPSILCYPQYPCIANEPRREWAVYTQVWKYFRLQFSLCLQACSKDTENSHCLLKSKKFILNCDGEGTVEGG